MLARGIALICYLVALAGAGAFGVFVLAPALGLEMPYHLNLTPSWAIPAAERLETGGPYRVVRHPLMACLLVFLWTQPAMKPTLLLLDGGLTLFVLLGVTLEERDLMRTFPHDYPAYRRRVPMLIPWRGMSAVREVPRCHASPNASAPSSSTRSAP